MSSFLNERDPLLPANGEPEHDDAHEPAEPAGPSGPVPGVAARRSASDFEVIARELVEGTRKLSSLVGEFSEAQLETVGLLVQQVAALDEISAQLRRYEAARDAQFEAEMGPPIPLDSLIAFQPDMRVAPPQGHDVIVALRARAEEQGAQRVEASAAVRLIERLGDGLRPANQLGGAAAVLSADDQIAGVVSVNVLPRGKDAERIVELAAYHRAGGAGPIAIEQHGDSKSDDPDLDALSKRAVESAALVIDPARLSPAEQGRLEAVGDSGGETGLDVVPPGAIVAVLVSIEFAKFLSTEQIARHHIQFVGNISGPVYYAATETPVEITHPDFKSGVRDIYTANPGKMLLTHTTRLGRRGPL